MGLCLEGVEEMLISIYSVVGRRLSASLFIPAIYLFPRTVTTPNPSAVLSRLTAQNAVRRSSVSKCGFDSHVLSGGGVFLICIRLYFMSLNLTEPTGKYVTLNSNASLPTIQMGPCFLFAYHQCMQNPSKSCPGGEGEMGEGTAEKKELEVRHSC